MGWFYAFLYFCRYNLTVAMVALGALITKEDFGFMFGVGAWVYALSFLVNGPLTDWLGGRVATLISAAGACAANLAMGFFIYDVMTSNDPGSHDIRFWMSILYGANMYFQSFGAVSIIKVNSAWFHLKERGVFSGIFGMMISSGIFLAFSVNGALLKMTEVNGIKKPWIVFFVPAACLAIIFVVEALLLRDTPAKAGFQDFNTGDATSGKKTSTDDSTWKTTMDVMKKVVTDPIILTLALVEFCTGVLRQGVMHWGAFYVKEVWALHDGHGLRYGSWSWMLFIGCTILAAPLLIKSLRKLEIQSGLRRDGRDKEAEKVPWKRWFNAALAVFLVPFAFAGWGGLLMAAGTLGGVVAGQMSHVFFQDRRPPAAGFLYILVTLCTVGMLFSVGGDSNVVGRVIKDEIQLRVGDRIVKVQDTVTNNWDNVRHAVEAVPAKCATPGSVWDTANSTCSTKPKATNAELKPSGGTILVTVERFDLSLRIVVPIVIEVKDPKSVMKAGERRVLNAAPRLDKWPWFLGIFLIAMSFGVIGTHGLLSGVMTQDFGGTKGAGIATGIVDGFVYLGTGVQSMALGYLTTTNWLYWPLFLIPFGIIGFFLLTRIWNVKPKDTK